MWTNCLTLSKKKRRYPSGKPSLTSTCPMPKAHKSAVLALRTNICWYIFGHLGTRKAWKPTLPCAGFTRKKKRTSYSHSGAFPWISTERNGKKQSKEIPWSGNRVVISPDGTQRPSNSSPYKHCLPICSLALPEKLKGRIWVRKTSKRNWRR